MVVLLLAGVWTAEVTSLFGDVVTATILGVSLFDQRIHVVLSTPDEIFLTWFITGKILHTRNLTVTCHLYWPCSFEFVSLCDI